MILINISCWVLIVIMLQYYILFTRIQGHFLSHVHSCLLLMVSSHIYSGSRSKPGHGCGRTKKTNKKTITMTKTRTKTRAKTKTKTRLFGKQPQRATLETAAHLYSGSWVSAVEVNDNDKDKDNKNHKHKKIQKTASIKGQPQRLVTFSSSNGISSSLF